MPAAAGTRSLRSHANVTEGDFGKRLNCNRAAPHASLAETPRQPL